MFSYFIFCLNSSMADAGAGTNTDTDDNVSF